MKDVTCHVERNAGHPWDSQRKGFDVLHVRAESDAALDRFLTMAKMKFWQPWLIGKEESTGKPGGALFKPCDIAQPWEDSPEQPHPGCVRSEA